MRFWNFSQHAALSFAALSISLGIFAPALAEQTYTRVYDARAHQYVYVPKPSTTDRVKANAQYYWKNPVVKQATIGAGIGAASGLLFDRTSVFEGAAAGAIVGAGTGWLDKSGVLDDHPAIKSSVKGAAIGTGVGAVSGSGLGKGAVIGAAAGAGAHYVKDYLDLKRQNQYSSPYRP